MTQEVKRNSPSGGWHQPESIESDLYDESTDVGAKNQRNKDCIICSKTGDDGIQHNSIYQ